MLVARMTAPDGPEPIDFVRLTADQRHLRRRMLRLVSGDDLMVDLAAAIRLENGDRLVLDDGRHVAVVAAAEPLLEVRARDVGTLARLAWHLGNRHARIEIDDGALMILPDHVLAGMIAGLGGTARPVEAPFQPEPPRLTGVPHHHAHD